MTDSSRSLRQLIDQFTENSAYECNENERSFRVRILEQSVREETLAQTKALDKLIEALNAGKVVLNGEISGDHDDIQAISMTEIRGETIDLVVDKRRDDDETLFFTSNGVLAYLAASDNLPKKVLILGLTEPFSTYTTDFVSLNGDDSASEDHSWTGVSNPNRVVRDLTNSNTLTGDLGQWITVDEIHGRVHSDVSAVFCSKLVPTLSDGVFRENNRTFLRFAGEHRVDVEVPTDFVPDSAFYNVLRLAVLWVYGNPDEVETKHSLFGFQCSLVRVETVAQISTDQLSRFLAGAKTAYRFHLQQRSRETIQSLMELRQSVSQEVSAVVADTIGLMKGLWRDFFISLAVVTMSFLTNSASNPFSVEFVRKLAAGYLIVSFVVSSGIDIRALVLSAKRRSRWHIELYWFLTDKDRRELITDPIARAYRLFAVVLAIGSAAYVFLVFVLLGKVQSFDFFTNWLSDIFG